MELTIKLTTEQLNYLITESEKLNITKEKVISNLLDIQIDMQSDLEADLTLDMWSDDEMMPEGY